MTTRARAYTLHLDNNKKPVIVRGDGTVCTQERNGIPDHPDAGLNSARLIVRNGYVAYALGTGPTRKLTFNDTFGG